MTLEDLYDLLRRHPMSDIPEVDEEDLSTDPDYAYIVAVHDSMREMRVPPVGG